MYVRQLVAASGEYRCEKPSVISVLRACSLPGKSILGLSLHEVLFCRSTVPGLRKSTSYCCGFLGMVHMGILDLLPILTSAYILLLPILTSLTS